MIGKAEFSILIPNPGCSIPIPIKFAQFQFQFQFLFFFHQVQVIFHSTNLYFNDLKTFSNFCLVFYYRQCILNLLCYSYRSMLWQELLILIILLAFISKKLLNIAWTLHPQTSFIWYILSATEKPKFANVLIAWNLLKLFLALAPCGSIASRVSLNANDQQIKRDR